MAASILCVATSLDEEKQSFDWALAWLQGPGPPDCPASSSKARSSTAESSGKISEQRTCSFGALRPAEWGGEPGRGGQRSQPPLSLPPTADPVTLAAPGPAPRGALGPSGAERAANMSKKDFEISTLIAVIISMVAAISTTTMATVQNQVATAAAVNQLTKNITQAFKKTALLFQDVCVAVLNLQIQDLKSANQRDEIAGARATLKENSPLLHSICSACLEHSDVASLKASKDTVCEEMQNALNVISNVSQGIHNMPTPSEPQAATLGSALDELENLIVLNPLVVTEEEIRPSLEKRLEAIISGAALLADSSCTRDFHRERIIAECNAIRQALQDLLSEYMNNEICNLNMPLRIVPSEGQRYESPQQIFPAEKGIPSKEDLVEAAHYPLYQLIAKNKKSYFCSP
ncbi:Catenin alpha-3 [Fukomys damarensis]|uniref:Catenin alpha-3 n=1 Tax=Fukomys damarensis TaxID=885580 RepID=A0A091E2Y1_FUKDA|nr:Catenin alpha-3 [Fukomys damarensis]